MELVDVLTKDMNKIMGYFKKAEYESDLQFWMRIAVRTVVDSMDALIFRMRNIAKDLIKLRGIEKKLPPKPKKTDLRHIFKELAVAIDSTFEIKEDDKRLQDYSDAREIRRRITHPKERKNLNISVEKEYVRFMDTFFWFTVCFKQLVKQSKISAR